MGDCSIQFVNPQDRNNVISVRAVLQESKVSQWFQRMRGQVIVVSQEVGERQKRYAVQNKDLLSKGISQFALKRIQIESNLSRRYVLIEKMLFSLPSHRPNLSLYIPKQKVVHDSQQTFIEGVQKGVNEIVKWIKQNELDEMFVEQDAFDEDLCLDIISKAALTRRNIAKEQGSEDFVKFGLKRAESTLGKGNIYTHLRGQYVEYGFFLTNQIELELQKYPELQEIHWTSEENFSCFHSLRVTIEKKAAEALFADSFQQIPVKRLSAVFKLGIFDAIIVTTSFQNTNNDFVTLSKYVIPLPVSFSSSLAMRRKGYFHFLLKRKAPIIVHQESHNFEKMYPLIVMQMQNCLQKKQNEQDLKKAVGILRYLLTHASLYYRGSSAITEIIEKAMYQYHGYHLEYKYRDAHLGRPSGDLDVFCYLRIEDYMKAYMNNAHLTRL